jgi:hypothetical protein
MEKTSSNCHYGLLPSLYGSLEPTAVTLLEQAALYYRVRAFTESFAIFNAFPPSQLQHPVIALEHSIAHMHRWSLLDCERVLRESLAWGEANAPDFEKPGIYTVLRLGLGAVQIWRRGDLTKARDSMMELRIWLADKPIALYNELEVYPIRP